MIVNGTGGWQAFGFGLWPVLESFTVVSIDSKFLTRSRLEGQSVAGWGSQP